MLVDSSEVLAQFQRAHSAHVAGDLDTAVSIYESILAAHDDHAPSLHGLGNIMLRRGMVDRADDLIRAALRSDPLGVGYNVSLGNVRAARGQTNEARQSYLAELKVRPDFAVAHHQLGSLALDSGQLDAAIGHFQNALKFSPQFAVAANNLGRALNNARRHDDAAEAFRHALRIDPGFAQAYSNLGHVCRLSGALPDAQKHFTQALELDPTLGGAQRGLAQIALAQDQSADAVTHLQAAIRLDPGDKRAMALLGATYFAQGMSDQANVTYAKAIDLAPDDPDLMTDAAAVCRVVGDDDQALLNYKSALKLRSTHQDALSGLALLMADQGDVKAAAARLAPSVNSGRAGPELLGTYAGILGRLGRRREGIALLEKALQQSQPPAVAMRLHYALAALLDGEGSYDLAFFHCRRANDERQSTFDPTAFEQHIDGIISAFGRTSATLPDSDWHEPTAVFVVGLPRSGVGIASRLLNAHPAIANVGASAQVEASILALWQQAGGQWPQSLAGLTAQDSTRAAFQSLTDRLPVQCDQAFFLDATWRNYLYLGVIARLFPGVRIVECVRDARDVARSCFFADFATSKGLPFSYDLGHIAAYVNNYRRLMAHWRATLNVSIHSLSYERLVLDAKTECRALADFLGVPFMAEQFGLNPANDPSGWRLDAKALRRYRHYRTHLEPFVDALDAPPDA
ncbi:MAG: tetratricopeptide repeat protein [Gammaproteobacteria bacterium]